MEHFYIILPSDSSLEYFPENTTTCYTTKLPKELNLSGKWEVGLAEITLPFTILQTKNIGEIFLYDFKKPNNRSDYQTFIEGNDYQEYNHQRYLYETSDKETHITLQSEYFGSLQSLITELNNKLNIYHIQINLIQDDYVEISTSCDSLTCIYDHVVYMKENLFNLLGFHATKRLTLKVNETVRSKYPGDILRNLPYEGYVYTNICEPHIVGNVHTTILRAFPIKYDKFKFGSVYNVIFSTINYIPLLINSIRTIDIDIRDRLGKNLPFEFGTSSVTLHFRRTE